MERRELAGMPDGVSVITLGTMLFGRPVPRQESIHLVHAALDLGVNLFDTADIYEGYDRFLGSPGGVAETILGEALSGRRDRAYITTKVGNPVGSSPHGGHPAGADYAGTGLGVDHVERQIDASLRRLRTDYVDYYLLHIADPDTPLEATLGAVDRLGHAPARSVTGGSPTSTRSRSRPCSACAAPGSRRRRWSPSRATTGWNATSSPAICRPAGGRASR